MKTTEEIIEEFNKKFNIDDDLDNELYQKTPWGYRTANDNVESFLRDALQAQKESLLEEIIEMFEEKPGESGWSREFNERFLAKLKEMK